MRVSCIKAKFILKNNLDFSRELQSAGSKLGKSAFQLNVLAFGLCLGFLFQRKKINFEAVKLIQLCLGKGFKNILRHKNFGSNIPEMIAWIHSSVSNMAHHCYLGWCNARNIGQWKISSQQCLVITGPHFNILLGLQGVRGGLPSSFSLLFSTALLCRLNHKTKRTVPSSRSNSQLTEQTDVPQNTS